MTTNRRVMGKIKECEVVTECIENNQFVDSIEKELRKKGYKSIAGLGNAGRGAIAGPIVAATVILSEDYNISGVEKINKLTDEKREELFETIMDNAIVYSLGVIDCDVIEQINLSRATELAMKISLYKMVSSPCIVISDSLKFSDDNIKHMPVINGESKSFSIAAAGIIARVKRDRIMKKMDLMYPGYGFGIHKGYATKGHIETIEKIGLSSIHRRDSSKKYINNVRFDQISVFQINNF